MTTHAVHHESAQRSALTAAQAAGVVVGELHELPAIEAAAALYERVWHSDTRSAPVNPHLMRALSHAGGYVAGAFDGDLLVAASVAFHTRAGLHSHISAVLPEVQGRDVGRALKLHQRAWALQQGITTISWTYDPLLRRNAWFNLGKLGARATDYLVDFYGPMDDAQNSGDQSDRAVAVWDLLSPPVVEAADGARRLVDLDQLRRTGAVVGLSADDDGRPVATGATGAQVLVEVPVDLQRLRLAAPDVARQWREQSRAVLGPLLTGGWVATTFTRSGWYVLEEMRP